MLARYEELYIAFLSSDTLHADMVQSFYMSLTFMQMQLFIKTMQSLPVKNGLFSPFLYMHSRAATLTKSVKFPLHIFS